MIRKSLLILLSAVLVAPSIANGQDAKAFLGDWVLTIEGRSGPQDRPLKITETGGKLSAVYGTARGRAADITITDITVKGSEATLKFMQTTQQREIPVVMTLTMKDGGLIVKLDMGGQFTQNGTGKRKAG